MVAALIIDSSIGHNTIGHNVLRVVQLDVIRTLNRRNVCEGRLSSRTRHTCYLLRDGMCVGCHQADPLSRLSLQFYVGTPTITLAGVLQHEGRRVCTETNGIDRTAVNTVETRETAYAGDSPVGDEVIVNLLVEDTLYGQSEGEANRNLVVDSQ